MSSEMMLGDRIQIAIEDSVFNAKEVADQMGITPQAISKAIKNHSMGKPNLKKMAAITGCNEGWLIHGKSDLTGNIFDPVLMAKCIAAMEKVAEEMGFNLSQEKLNAAALTLYKEAIHSQK